MSQPATIRQPGTAAEPIGLHAPQGFGRRLKVAMSSSPFYMGVILALLVAFFSFLHPATFASSYNIRNIFLDASVLLILAVGTTYIMIAGGFDLSIGSVLVFSGVVAAQVMLEFGTDSLLTVAIGFVVALACGTAWGVFNGFCITKLRVSALISTLGTMGAALGAAYLVTDGNDIRTVPNALIAVGHGSIGGVPWLVVITAVVSVVGGVVLHMTQFGRHTFLVGSNPEGSRRAGINVSGHLLKLYALSGLLAGFAAMLSLGRFSTRRSKDTRTIRSRRSPRWFWAARRSPAGAAPSSAPSSACSSRRCWRTASSSWESSHSGRWSSSASS